LSVSLIAPAAAGVFLVDAPNAALLAAAQESALIPLLVKVMHCNRAQKLHLEHKVVHLVVDAQHDAAIARMYYGAFKYGLKG